MCEFDCELRLGQVHQNRKKKDQDKDNIDNNFGDDDFVFPNLKSYYDKDCDINDRFVQVFDETGSKKTVLKSSLVWVLTQTKGVLSKDRLRREQVQSANPTKRKNITRKDIEITPQVAIKRRKHLIGIREDDEIKVGSWCLFKRFADTPGFRKVGINLEEDIVHGVVLAFKYVDGNNEKEKQYTMDFAFISSNKKTNDQEIQALATWYKYGEDRALVPLSENNNFFIDIKNYIATVNAPSRIENQIIYENHDEIKNYILSQNICNKI